MRVDSDKLAVGVDIGGTNVKLGVIDHKGQFIRFTNLPVIRDETGALSVDDIAGAIRELISDLDSSIEAIGICTPGNLDIERGLVELAVNLGWENVPLGAMLEDRLNRPVTIESDVVAGAVGEHQFGSVRGKSQFIYISLGTGIGGTYCINNEFIRTASGSLVHYGHMSMDVNGKACGCGNYGCLEQYASGSAIVSRVNLEREYKSTRLNDHLPPGQPVLNLKIIHKLAQEGDAYCQEVLLDAGTYLGVALVSITNLLGPGTIVIGGGASVIEQFYVERARRIVAERLKPYMRGRTEIVTAQFPHQAGVYGAAYKAMKSSH